MRAPTSEPRACHPLVDRVPDEDVYRFLDGVAQAIERYCASTAL